MNIRQELRGRIHLLNETLQHYRNTIAVHFPTEHKLNKDIEATQDQIFAMMETLCYEEYGVIS